MITQLASMAHLLPLGIDESNAHEHLTYLVHELDLVISVYRLNQDLNAIAREQKKGNASTSTK